MLCHQGATTSGASGLYQRSPRAVFVCVLVEEGPDMISCSVAPGSCFGQCSAIREQATSGVRLMYPGFNHKIIYYHHVVNGVGGG